MKKTKGQTFDNWMADVEMELEDLAGIGSGSIPDYDYMTAYEDDKTAYEAASEALEAAGF